MIVNLIYRSLILGLPKILPGQNIRKFWILVTMESLSMLQGSGILPGHQVQELIKFIVTLRIT